ncbi:MAG: carbon-nitrogen hydrolase family protein [Planctomycetes bacterium]|nr:carbon-nitrogen hydrolase family protein [Planctomycetota bacterium]
MSHIKVAMLQMYAHQDDMEANRKKGMEFCRRASEQGADIAFMPEEWSSGCAKDNPDHIETLQACMDDSITEEHEFVTSYQQLAKELNMAIAVSYLQTWEPAPRNVMTLFDRHGKKVFTYAKVHLCPFFRTEAILTAGTSFEVGTLDTVNGPVKVGAQICYDISFPESTRTLMLNGAEVVLTALGASWNKMNAQVLAVRAYENAVGLAMAVYPGPSAYNVPMEYSSDGTPLLYATAGQSTAFDHNGDMLALGGETEEIVYADFDLTSLRQHRSVCTNGNAYRRPHVYQTLTDMQVEAPFHRNHALGEKFVADGEAAPVKVS